MMRYCCTDLGPQLIADPFVGVHEEHMIHLIAQQLEREIALISIVHKAPLLYARAGHSSKSGRFVVTEGIQHQHQVSEAQTIETVANMALFVEGQHHRRQLEAAHQSEFSVRRSSSRTVS